MLLGGARGAYAARAGGGEMRIKETIEAFGAFLWKYTPVRWDWTRECALRIDRKRYELGKMRPLRRED